MTDLTGFRFARSMLQWSTGAYLKHNDQDST